LEQIRLEATRPVLLQEVTFLEVETLRSTLIDGGQGYFVPKTSGHVNIVTEILLLKQYGTGGFEYIANNLGERFLVDCHTRYQMIPFGEPPKQR
jgi:hypothetical protein